MSHRKLPSTSCRSRETMPCVLRSRGTTRRLFSSYSLPGHLLNPATRCVPVGPMGVCTHDGTRRQAFIVESPAAIETVLHACSALRIHSTWLHSSAMLQSLKPFWAAKVLSSHFARLVHAARNLYKRRIGAFVPRFGSRVPRCTKQRVTDTHLP